MSDISLFDIMKKKEGIYMKVIIINASPRSNGNTNRLLGEVKKTFEENQVQWKEFDVGKENVRGCLACGYCKKGSGCVLKDIVNDIASVLKDADGLIVASPVYFASPNGTLISLLDRLFYSASFSMKMKVGACFAIARRAGTTASFDVLNKYFTISGMPVVSGDYWNNGYGRMEGEIEKDEEGLRNARIVAKRMVFLMKSIADGKNSYGDLLEDEARVMTNFIK